MDKPGFGLYVSFHTPQPCSLHSPSVSEWTFLLLVIKSTSPLVSSFMCDVKGESHYYLIPRAV